MIVRPNAESAPASKTLPDAVNGHPMKMDKSFTTECENSAATVNTGAACSGFNFDTGPDGVNNTPKSTQDIYGFFGISEK